MASLLLARNLVVLERDMATTTPLLDGERPGRDRTLSRSGDTAERGDGLEDGDTIRRAQVRIEHTVDHHGENMRTRRMLEILTCWATSVVFLLRLRLSKTSLGSLDGLAWNCKEESRLVIPCLNASRSLKPRALMHAN